MLVEFLGEAVYTEVVGHIPAGKHREKSSDAHKRPSKFPILQYFLARIYTLDTVCRDIANSLPSANASVHAPVLAGFFKSS